MLVVSAVYMYLICWL